MTTICSRWPRNCVGSACATASASSCTRPFVPAGVVARAAASGGTAAGDVRLRCRRLSHRRRIDARSSIACAKSCRSRGSAMARFVCEGRHVRAIVDPIGIDAEGFAETAARADRTASRRGGCAKAWAAARSPSASIGSTTPRAWSIGSRRSAGCSAKYPEHRRQVSFLQIAARSREESGSYQRCGASSIASSATPTAATPNSTGCRCAI